MSKAQLLISLINTFYESNDAREDRECDVALGDFLNGWGWYVLSDDQELRSKALECTDLVEPSEDDE